MVSEGRVTLKSSNRYKVKLKHLNIALDGTYPESGEIQLTEELVRQLRRDSEQFGNWQSVQHMELSFSYQSKTRNVSILVQDIFESRFSNFVTTGVFSAV
ncbi:hypothetical protein A1OS_12125 [Enterovibrio norvegicus]|uniref:hypothetical protein n=1 Tax=Enterovibrio norvegicus TaxID=188144 RepID=UPI00036052AE|nr:hypothetical protein [Enterovibrio norvegicus]OEE69052.1 hypothetical protein A1OS_12125 [Enterovibrio norvegicus]